MRKPTIILAFALIACAAIPPAQAQDEPPQAVPTQDEAAIRTLIAAWYEARRAGPAGRPHALHAPGAIDASPGYVYPRSRSAAAAKPIYNSLAHRALVFSHEITHLKIDPRFARARVWERGYFYAWAAQQTYENAGAAIFVLEKQDDGRWLVLAHQTHTVGIPPDLQTRPMPDLRDLFYATHGKGRDPEADARAGRNR